MNPPIKHPVKKVFPRPEWEEAGVGGIPVPFHQDL